MLQIFHDHKIQLISILGSFVLFCFILRLVKNKKLKEEYSLLWLGFSFCFLLLSVFRPLLDTFADLVGIHYPPAALLLFLFVSLLCVLIQFSMVMSKLSNRNKNLVQELGILKHEVETLKKDFKSSKSL